MVSAGASSTSPFGTIAVIVGAVASHPGTVGRVERAMKERGFDHTMSVANGSGDAERLTAAALDRGERFVVAVGDDATVHDVVNGMLRGGRTILELPILGVVAAGTDNGLVRSFNLPGDVADAADHLVGERTYAMDLMKITCVAEGGTRTRYAHNLAQLGLGALADLRRRSLPPWLGDHGRAFLGFWTGFLGSRPFSVRIDHDAKRWEGRAFQIVIGNAQYAAGGLRLSPRSWPGDGVLDALVFTGQKSDAYTMMPRIMRQGDHIPDPKVRELRAKVRFAIDTDPPLTVVADGHTIGATPATFQVLPRQLLFKV
jgi:diacylglycerol kinase (ATP)